MFLVAESFTKKMAYSWKSWAVLLVSICSALYVHKACGDCPHIDEFWASWCFYLCWVKIIGGVLLKLLEYCYMNENPHDQGCSPQSECWTFFITDLPILVLSIAVLWSQPTCEESSKFSSFLRACWINGLISMVIYVYYMLDSVIKRGDRCTAAIYFITVMTAEVVFLRSLCII